LHHEVGLQNVRIATFGYNSSSNVLAPNSNLSIPDFANQLLLYLNQLNYRDGSVCVPFAGLTAGCDYFPCTQLGRIGGEKSTETG
jgi:hypothetical protein